jgi:hypothetical protein
MKITATAEELQALWDAARAATDEAGNDYAEGAYDVIQAVTGVGSVEDVIRQLNDRGE